MKKGDKVWHFVQWDNLRACAYRHFTVESCGKKQMTLRADDDTMRKHFVYARDYHFVLPDKPGFDPVEQARKFSAEFINSGIVYCEQRLQNPAFHHESVREEMNKLIEAEPRAISWEDAEKEVVARIARDRAAA